MAAFAKKITAPIGRFFEKCGLEVVDDASRAVRPTLRQSGEQVCDIRGIPSRIRADNAIACYGSVQPELKGFVLPFLPRDGIVVVVEAVDSDLAASRYPNDVVSGLV